MFQTPKAQTPFVPLAEPLDVNSRYLFRCRKIEDKGVGQFDDANDPEAPHRLLWTFWLATLDKTPILNVEGDPYEHRQFTSNRTGKGKKTAVARTWMEALLGRELEDSEIKPGIEKDLFDKVAVGLLEGEEKTSQEGEVYTKYTIVRLSPFKSGAPAAVPKTAPARAANPPMKQAVAVAGAVDAPW